MFPSTNTLVSEFSGRSSEFVPDTDLLVFTDSVFISNFSILSFKLEPRKLFFAHSLLVTKIFKKSLKKRDFSE